MLSLSPSPSPPTQTQGLRDRWLQEKRRELAAVDALAPIARDLGCSLAQLALAWCARNERVSTVITGATSVAQVRENFKALSIVPRLTPDVVARVDAALAAPGEGGEAGGGGGGEGAAS